MTTLKLFNTLSRTVEAFEPIDANNVRMYVCGITPYDDAHIGHARVYVVFDVLFRLLRHMYGDKHVTYVRNFTDIDDKIIVRAATKTDTPATLAQQYINSFHADMQALNVLAPTHEPRVSDSLAEIVLLIDNLLKNQMAYQTPSGDVMYHADKFADFGKLARRDLTAQQHGARVAVDDEKQNAADFVLWKSNAKSATKLEQAFMPADFGATQFNAAGRPGWHIECSAMSKKWLGDSFDIHGGGEDLIFPHHCCEIAQTEALTHQPMAKYWLHNSFITVGGTKMSKSLGNFTTIKNALAKYSPEAVRLWLLQTHYRKPVDYSEEALHAAQVRVDAWRREAEAAPDVASDVDAHLIAALAEDLNTAKALAYINEEDHSGSRLAMLKFLGLLPPPQAKAALSAAQQKWLDERGTARTNKNWAESDRLRDELLAQGIVVEDKPDGTTTWRRR